ncbi:cupin domain-containing protein [Actinomadura atramentaria]|uniref:cupin domain-containing protein n=1 Tax=Actinomadura atramentaria TaxID=1990 RepID=UPI00037269D0|nr:cupin domain-containing protein [Actinomadura atramentaria]
MAVSPIDLFTSDIRFGPDGRVRAEPAAPAAARDGWRLTARHAKTAADVRADQWEIHPEADEIVSCLIGKIRLHLRPERPGQAEEVVRLRAGTAAIVPCGRWHRIELDVPSSIIAVTLPRGSRREGR